MKLSSIVVSVIVFSLVFMSFAVVLKDFDSQMTYGSYTNVNTASFDKFNYTSSAQTESNKLLNTTEGIKFEEGNDEASLLKGGWAGIRYAWQSFSLIHTVINDLREVIGLPPYVTSAINALLIISVSFALLYFIWRYREE